METTIGNTSKARENETLLISRILDGQTALFRELAGRYAGQVLLMVARLIPSPEEAEEATQDTLMEAFQSLSRYDAQRASFRTWLMRIAYHTALKHYRQKHRWLPMVEVEQQRLDAFPDDETDALLDDTDRVELMERAIETLKPEPASRSVKKATSTRGCNGYAKDWPSPSEVLKVKNHWAGFALEIIFKIWFINPLR